MALSSRRDTRVNIAEADAMDAQTQLTATGDLRTRDDDAIAILTTMDADTGGLATTLTALNVLITALNAHMGEGTTYVAAAVNLAMNGTRDILAAPGASKQIWVYGLAGTTCADGTILLLDDTPTSWTGVMPIAALGGFVLPISPNANAPWVKCSTNKKLQATLSVNSDFDGVVVYAIVDV